MSNFYNTTLGFGRNYGLGEIVNEICKLYKKMKGDDIDDEMSEDDVQGGTYRGFSQDFRAWMKILPFHNYFELSIDPAAKRRYHETLVMKLSEQERESWLYDLIEWFNGENDK